MVIVVIVVAVIKCRSQSKEGMAFSETAADDGDMKVSYKSNRYAVK